MKKSSIIISILFGIYKTQYAAEVVAQSQYPNGIKIIVYKDRTITCIHPNGTEIHLLPDKTSKTAIPKKGITLLSQKQTSLQIILEKMNKPF